jgi:hypothetical protein
MRTAGRYTRGPSEEENRVTFRTIRFVVAAAALLAAIPAGAVSREDFKTYLETRDALQDERVLKMPEEQRIPKIASVNFKMKGDQLQAILDKVEAEGGEKVIAQKSQAAVTGALETTPVKERVKEVKVDTASPHVVTYIKWVADETNLEAEAALLAHKAGSADKVTSTFFLWAVDASGKDLWRAKIGADRTERIKEDRIGDWAKTRYIRLFEVDKDNRG